MSDSDKQLTFLHEVESDVVEESKGLFGAPGEFREVTFTQIISEEMEAAGVLESPVVCRFESGKAGSAIKCNGYSIPEEDSRLDLFVTLYKPGPHAEIPALNASDVDVAFNKLERFLGKALTLDGLSSELDVSMPEWHMAKRIQDLAGDFDRVNFHLLTNSRLAVRRAKERKQTVQNIPACYEIWDLERFRRLRESGAGYESVNVDLRSQPHGGLACVMLEQPEKDWRTCVAIFPGTMLANLYDEHGSRLLELNVRSYLQARGKVNKGILETLCDRPSDFMAYNNGITIVAEDLEFGYLDNGVYGIVELKGMQIVNGGQTTASIHRALKEYGKDLSKVFVQSKIVVVSSGRFNEVVPLISRFANSQNKVTEPDLAANHPFHVGIERVAQREWSPDQSSKWFYERSRGSYQTTRSRDGRRSSARKAEFEKRFPKAQCFDKEDLARFECCWLGHASQVNKGRQKCFAFFMTLLKTERPEFPEGWEPDVSEFKGYIAKAILYRSVQAVVRQNEAITAYRINVANFVAALIAEKSVRRIDLDKIWQLQDIGPALTSTAAKWAPVVFRELLSFAQKQSAHIDNVLKGEALWEHIKSLDLELGSEVEKGLLSAGAARRVVEERPIVSKNGKKDATKEKLTQQDQNNIALCMELPARSWLELIQWGGQGNLEPWMCNIASTVAGQAANGWKRPITKNQAKYLVEAIKAARKAGLFS